MAAQPIDVWDFNTFDPALIAAIEGRSELIKRYLQTDQKNFLAYDLGREPRQSLLRPDNPFASEFHALEEVVGKEMECRTIRAFHYTRMTDNEVAMLRRDGIHLSMPDTLRRRLNDLVTTGSMPLETADNLYAQSPFHSDQLESRSNKFWMASHPIEVDNGGVVPLMSRWGGEVASMYFRDQVVLDLLASIGRPRIVEVAVPLVATRHSYSAGKAVITTFARSIGCISEKSAFDLYTKQSLPASAILAVRTDGDAEFVNMGRSYPGGYVDVSKTYWKELTGED